MGTKWFSIVVLSVAIFLLALKKKISELKLSSILLFISVIVFCILMPKLLISAGDVLPYEPGDEKEYYEITSWKTFTMSLSIPVVAYGFQIGFFPIYNALEVKTYHQGMKTVIIAMTIIYAIFMIIIFLSAYSFGNEIKSDMLINVSAIDRWESYIMRGVFLIVVIIHTPFFFFIVKEALLCLVWMVYEPLTQGKQSKNGKHKYGKILDDVNENANDHNNAINEGSALNQPGDDNSIIDDETKQGLVDPNNNEELLNVNDKLEPLESVHKTISGALVSDNNGQNVEDLLPDWIYYSSTIFLFLVISVASCFIEDVGRVIGLVGSFTSLLLYYAFPALFYYVILSRSDSHGTPKWQLYFALFMSVFCIIASMSLTSFYLYVYLSQA